MFGLKVGDIFTHVYSTHVAYKILSIDTEKNCFNVQPVEFRSGVPFNSDPTPMWFFEIQGNEDQIRVAVDNPKAHNLQWKKLTNEAV